MFNLAKDCVRYLWDHNWSPIRSPTFTVEFFSLFHLILIPNLIASMAQFINKSRASSCEDTCCRNRKRVTLTPSSPRELMLVRKAGLNAGTDPAAMLHPDFRAPHPRGRWLSPHPCAPSSSSAEDFHPNKLWVASLLGWALGWGCCLLISQRPWNCLRTVSHLFWCELLWGSC